MTSIFYNIPKWMDENEKYFLPPVCNKMMHGEGQLKVFYVGGPNIRKDFHIEEGEEFFYMRQGDMNLICQERGKFRDVIIKEGEVFLLPGMIPHSPQRFQNTVGLVIERERLQKERDCLRYFVGSTTETLFEKWFYCEDLGVQLGPVIKEYFASVQHKTGKPIPGTITKNPPFKPDALKTLVEPFPLQKWITKHRGEIDQEGGKRLFDLSFQSDVIVFGEGKGEVTKLAGAETWLWQQEGESRVTINGENKKLLPDDSLLIRSDISYEHERAPGSLTLSVVLDSANKKRAFTHFD